MEEYRLHIQSKYDEYLMKTENRGISYGEIAYIQNLDEKELKELEEELEEDEEELEKELKELEEDEE